MAYNSTTWSPESITKASESTVTTTNDLTVSGDLTVTGADIVIGTDADGTDRTIVFGHSTLKSIVGVDDDQDVFAINTDAAFESTNDVEIDTSGNVTIGNGTLSVTGQINPTTHIDMPDSANVKLGTGDDLQIYHDGSNSYVTNSTGVLKLATESSGIAVSIGHTTSETTVNDNLTVTGDLKLSSNVIKASDGGSTITLDTSDNVTIAGDLTITGGKVTFGNGEVFHNETDSYLTCTTLALHVDSPSVAYCIIDSADGNDSSVAFAENGTTKWSMGQNGADTDLYVGQGNVDPTAGTILKLSTAGHFEVGRDGAVKGSIALWDGSGGNTPGYIVLYSPNGTANYIFCEDDGTLKRHTSAPTANGDGDAIGGQSD